MLVTLTVRHTRVVQFKSYMTVVRFYHQNFRSHINCFILHLSRHASWRNSNGVTSTSRFILHSKLKLWKLPDPRVENNASASLSNISWASCDLGLWPPDPPKLTVVYPLTLGSVAQRYRTLVFDRRAFAVLRSTYIQLTGDHLCS